MGSLLLLLIGIPLNLGIALASGMSATAGLVSGVIGGVVVGLLAGCPLMVTGPATGLIAVVWQITDKHGLAGMGPILLMAGLLQIVIGRLNMGPWFRAVAPAVIQGMLAGIGVLIFASQFHVMLELKPYKVGILNILTMPKVVYSALTTGSQSSHLAAILGAVTIFVTGIWGRLPGKARLIPGSLVGIAVSVAIASVGRFPVSYVQIPENLGSDLQLFRPEMLKTYLEASAWGSILALTLIATAQTLLTATAVDRLHGGEQTNYNQETIAQGAGNAIAGLLGVLPICGVIVRSASNLGAGARTRWSTVLHGVWLGIFAFLFADTMRILPISSLAGALVYTGYRLVDLKAVKELSKYSRGEVANYWVTLLAIVFTDVLTGILVGFTVSAARLIYVLTHCSTHYREDDGTGASVVEIKGSATFFTLPALARSLRKVPPKREVHIFVRGLNYIDHACLEHLMTWEERYIRQGGQVYVEWDHLIGRFNRPMTRDLAEKGAVQGALTQASSDRSSDAYDDLISRAIIVDLDEALNYSVLVESVARALDDRLPSSGRRNLTRALMHEFAEGGPKVVNYGALPNQLLFGLNSNELVVVRARQGVHLEPVGEVEGSPVCWLFLFSPGGEAGRHFRLLAALASRIEETQVDEWLALEGEVGLREFFSRHQRFVTVQVTATGATGEFVDRSVAQIAAALPSSSLIAWVDREGRGIVPKGQTVVKAGDRITILGNHEDIEQLARAYGRVSEAVEDRKESR